MSSTFYPKQYPVDALYSSIRDALWEVQHNLQAPMPLIAGSFWTAMSIASQGDIDVELPIGQIRPVCLDILTIADSGERKTATDSIVCASIYVHDEQQAKEYAKALAAYKVDLRFWNAIDASVQRKIFKAVHNGDDVEHLRSVLAAHGEKEPCKPHRRRIVHQNITERPLMEALQGNGKSIAILSDEGEIVLKGGAMNKLGTLNKAWDGAKSLNFDRADDSIEVTHPRLTISMMVQEKVFVDFMNKRGEIARASGHLARYLVAWPASTQGFRFMSLLEPIWMHLPKFHLRVTELLDATAIRHAAGDYSRKVLSFSKEAKELWVQTQNALESRLHQNGDLVSVRDFASKFMEIVSRMAAILHHISGQEGQIISMETLDRALEIGAWYFDEFINLFGDRNEEPQEKKDLRLLGMYLFNRYWKNQLASALRNEVRKNGPIRHQGRFEAALQQLCWENSVKVEHENAVKGKGRLWIHLNPEVFSLIERS
jgi:hypothetical protein